MGSFGDASMRYAYSVCLGMYLANEPINISASAHHWIIIAFKMNQENYFSWRYAYFKAILPAEEKSKRC